jgi:homotetrameric cytidine deaminase
VRGVAQARGLAEARAHVPASAYPVGAVLALDDGRRLPGVNVEHGDWTRTLCAERTALAAACAYGVRARIRALYLACPRDTAAVPCGACRQWLTELAPDAVLWMDRLRQAPAATRPAALLPGSFQGRALSPPLPDAPDRA